MKYRPYQKNLRARTATATDATAMITTVSRLTPELPIGSENWLGDNIACPGPVCAAEAEPPVAATAVAVGVAVKL
jgi:hypothetical protein